MSILPNPVRAVTQAGEWRGRVGDVWAREWRRTDRAFAGIEEALSAAVLAQAPAGLFAALDIGSGAGSTTLALAAARPEARITGIDLSPELVAVADAHKAGGAHCLTHVTFAVGDAASAAAGLAPLDLLMSRHGVMFFPDPVAAFTRFHAAARPGATLVFSCFRGRDENPWGSGAALAVAGAKLPVAPPGPGPFAFADPDHVAAILARAGWRDAEPERVDTIFRVGAGDDPVADAVAFFSRIGTAAGLLHDLPPAEAAAARERLAAFAARYRDGDAIDFPAAAWIWTAKA